ncbi:MAG: hypothetical protein QXO51_07185 [Halobacteria archaeon]
MAAGKPKEELAKALVLALAEAKSGYAVEREGDSLWVGEDALLQLHEEKRRLHLDLYFHMDLLPAAAARVAQVVERAARAHGVDLFVQEHFTLDEEGNVVYESELPECKVCGRRHPPEKPEGHGEGPEGLYA